jgi:plastocyanin
MRKVTTGVAVSALALGMAALSPSGAGAEESRALAGSHEVSQKNLQFNPFEMTVGVGDTVHWTNNEVDATIHSVVQQGGAEINSPDIPPGAHFEWTFTQPTTYTLTCRFHPDMFMTMNVVEAKAAAKAPAKAPAKGEKKAAGKKASQKKGTKKKGTQKKAAPPVNHDAHAESAAKSKPAPPPGPPESTIPGVGGLPISPER